VIRPVQSPGALLADIHASNRNDGNFRLWWLGQSGFLLQWQDLHILLDPYLSDSLTRKYSQTDKPHVRMTELAIEPARLSFVHIATSSHNHTDHLDSETLCPILEQNSNLRLVIPEANRAFVAERLKIQASRPIGLDDGTSAEICGVKFNGLASAHESLDCDEFGRAKYLGYVLEFGNWSLYHSGDTVRYDGMAEKLRRFEIDVALLPINGRAPDRRVPGNLFGSEAAQLAKDIRAQLVIPCHYEMFEFNTASPQEFIRECKQSKQPFQILRCGEKWDSNRFTS
jgi:L-ascorbate metabolism protein UlaG (beta-lactamase superfamily)